MKKWIIGIGFILIIAASIAIYKINDVVKQEIIYKGISIEEIDMSGKSKEEALERLEDIKKAEIKEKTMDLKGNDMDFTIDLVDIGFDYDYKTAVNKAYSLGRDGNIFKRYKEIKLIEKDNKNVELESYYDNKKIEGKVLSIAEEIDAEVVNSKFDFNGGNIIISDSKVGYEVDKKGLESTIEGNIYKLEDIEIPIKSINPEYTKDYYSKINGIIGKASTSFKNSEPGRVNNIILSTRVFNGKILHPGDSLSYNSTVGPINTGTGYQNAPVIIDGDLTPGVGGGICQTSTTLYNALLRADLTVTERSNHSIPSAYMDKGLDAVVAGDYLDLKFRNDFDYPIYISSRVVNKVVYFEIYGDAKNRDYTIQMEPKVIEVIPHKVKEILKKDMEAGTRELEQSGRNGYKVITYKHKVRDGKIIDTVQVSSDYYKEREAIYNIGPKKSEDKAEEVEAEEELEEVP